MLFVTARLLPSLAARGEADRTPTYHDVRQVEGYSFSNLLNGVTP